MINKDDVYSEVARTISRLSKDENTHIGAVIIGPNGEPVSWGYNGSIAGFPDDYIPHSRESKTLEYIENNKLIKFSENKYPFMSHAESNALFYADRSKLVGATLYVTGMPCTICAKEIARAKIAKVVIASITKNDAGGSVGKDEHITKFIFATKGIQLIIDGENVELGCFTD